MEAETGTSRITSSLQKLGERSGIFFLSASRRSQLCQHLDLRLQTVSKATQFLCFVTEATGDGFKLQGTSPTLCLRDTPSLFSCSASQLLPLSHCTPRI